MSEGTQAETRRITEDTKSSEERHQESQSRLALQERPELTRPTGPATALLALYEEGELVQKKTVFDPDKILIDFLKRLVASVQKETTAAFKDSEESSRAATALLETLDAAFKDQPFSSSPPNTTSWDPDLHQSVLHILETHSAFDESQDYKERAQNLAQQLREQQPKDPPTMDSFRPNEGGFSQRGVAERLGSGDGTDGGIVNLLANIGPSCTRNEATFRETLAQTSGTGALTEGELARLLHFFSDEEKRAKEGVSSGLSSSILGTLLPGRDNGDPSSGSGWNLGVVASVLRQDYTSLNWDIVARKFDFPSFVVQNADQFRRLLDLYRAGANRDPALSAFTSQWNNSAGQCSLLEAILSVPPNVYAYSLTEAEMADAATAAPEGQGSTPHSQGWASSDVLQRLLYLSDIPSLARRVRDLFVKGLLSCPEVLLCALVRLQLNAANAAARGSTDNMANAGMQMKGELMRELIPLFFKPNSHHRVQNGPAALRRLWSVSPNTVTAACLEAWRSTVSDSLQARRATIVHIIGIVRHLPTPESVIASLLNGGKDPEFSIAVAFVMSDSEILQLRPWLTERMSTGGGVSGAMFAILLIGYLSKTYASATPRSAGNTDGGSAPLVSLENVAISLNALLSLDPSIVSQAVPASLAENQGNILSGGKTVGESVKLLTEACVSTHPSIRSSLEVRPGASSPSADSATAPSSSGSSSTSDDIEEIANSYFQKIYTSEQSIGEVVDMLKRFKASGNQRENDIFACMIHNLFDEYRFFPKYPEKELRITGILFGTLIQEQLVSSITLGIALRYVLEALRKPPSPPGGTTSSSGKMFRFGMFALEQFKGRLHEWPQYCSHIVQIPHLKDGYADLVAEIETAMEKSKEKPAPVEEKRTPEFGPGLGRAVNGLKDTDVQHESPPDALLDRVQFLVNNLSQQNFEQKAQELKDLLAPQYFGWLGHYLVVKRISTQPNFHSTYLSFLHHLGDYGKGLVDAILSSVYLNVGKLLRSPKITTSTSERSLLKNLGSWLGQITLARNRPILQIMLDCKELLYQGYENGMLIAVTPFVAKTLDGAANSGVFRPPNPWLMGLLGVFRALYEVEDLKINIKFEVEVLCKNLGVKLEDIPSRTEDLQKRIPPQKERNPDFNLKSSGASQSSATAVGGAKAAKSALGSPDGKAAPGASGLLGSPGFGTSTGLGQGSAAGSQDQLQTVIPNLASYVKLNPSITQLLQDSGTLSMANLKRSVPVAVDRAIREIIQPVVERSVTIACVTTKEIVTKDFAMEGDENKMRKAAHLMVANLAGSLALVTCREPLRSSISSHLRKLLNGSEKLNDDEQKIVDQSVAICATDNVELGCLLIEKAATEKAVRDMDESLAPSLNARRKHREQTGQPFYDMSIFGDRNQRYPGALPEPLRPKPGGLRSEQLRVYEAFHRPQRQPESGGAAPSQVGAQPARPAGGAVVGSGTEGVSGSKPSSGQKLNMEALSAIASKVDNAVTSILSSAGPRAPEVTLSMLPPQHEIRQLLSAVKQVIPNANPSGNQPALTASEKEAVLGFSQSIFKRLYELSLSEPLRLEALVALLENINECCPKLGQDLGTWATYAPTETESQRKLHRTVLLLLIRSRLVPVQELDGFLSGSADNGRNPVWVEFSLLFIRTAFLERIASPADFPKLLTLMAKIADGSSQASPQVSQSLRKPILRMLEEVQAKTAGNAPGADTKPATPGVPLGNSSSLSSASLSILSRASLKAAESTVGFARNDPQNAKQQVTFLLDNWIRIHTEAASNEKTLAQYIQLLQQNGVGKMDDQTERFLRLSTLLVVEAVLKTKTADEGSSKSTVFNYMVVDIYSKLLTNLIKFMNEGGSSEQVAIQRVAFLNKALGVIVRSMMWDYEKTKKNPGKQGWDQRPWFRLFLNLLMDLASQDKELSPISYGILSIFGSAFHVVQPLVVPGFSFAWLELVSHRMFLPNLLGVKGRKGWNVAHQLLLDLFLFLEPHLRLAELTPPIKKLYEGTLRVLLVLLHDSPAFLAAYHISLCNVIPENCIQLRNLILSAVPKGMVLPEPFTPNLKIDLLPEIQQNPLVLSDVMGPLNDLRSDLDAFLKDRQGGNFLKGLLQRLCKEGTSELDVARVNSLVLYVGIQAIARLQNTQIAHTLAQAPEMEIIQKLMELDDKGRYTSLNAIANQLRYPSSHTHFFSCVMLFLFSESSNSAVKEQVTRVLVERLILYKPHPWGLLITFMELIKNQRYQFWSQPFTRCATEIEKMFENVARSCLAPGTQRATAVGGDEQQ